MKQLLSTYAIRSINLSLEAYHGEYGHGDLSFLNSNFDKVVSTKDDVKVEHFYATDADGVLYITFEGTDDLVDWEENLRFSHEKIKPYDNKITDIEIHTGFYNEYLIARNDIHLAMNTKYKDLKDVVVCGHSLGSALAVLCGIDIQYNFPDKNISVFGFGSPRVGNQAFVESFRKRIANVFEFQYNDDAIANVPPESFGYKHINLIHLSKVKNDKDAWWKFIPFLGHWGAHYPQNYLKALNEQAQNLIK